MQTMIFALETGVWVALIILVLILGAGLGVFLGYTLRLKKHDKTVADAKAEAAKIISQANEEANLRKKELISDAKDEIALLKQQADQDIKDRKSVVVELENKLNQREDMLDRRSSNLDHREDILSGKEVKLDVKDNEGKTILDLINEGLERSTTTEERQKYKLCKLYNYTSI